MSKFADNDVMDDGFDNLKANVDKMTVCEGQPTTYAEADTAKGSGGKKLAEVALAGGDFTIVDGDTSGRKITVAAKAGNTIDVSGDADHVALVDSGSSKLWYVTTATLQALVAGGTVDIPAWDAEIRDPA